ncbi:PREDICTED: uncharacterized protein LOC102009539 [Chinchilla lanigera]|uniref:uncharacterized protein LOC102009539 n=1 Tax=Chinchilla lanigera TaxID=34839 RepID=UPI00038E954F|nr:PREDICTED: uncharacterized protein LOC102009539 [Chinchilla lanigera]XP_013372091.1 PREDICTED: uncharacterized protein LOC102009539 [Chinchilla lanigera]XP_013372092.1 PREDICTED: uncharacterized protein LOC102009539 [Chinchilla lanigera]
MMDLKVAEPSGDSGFGEGNPDPLTSQQRRCLQEADANQKLFLGGSPETAVCVCAFQSPGKFSFVIERRPSGGAGPRAEFHTHWGSRNNGESGRLGGAERGARNLGAKRCQTRGRSRSELQSSARRVGRGAHGPARESRVAVARGRRVCRGARPRWARGPGVQGLGRAGSEARATPELGALQPRSESSPLRSFLVSRSRQKLPKALRVGCIGFLQSFVSGRLNLHQLFTRALSREGGAEQPSGRDQRLRMQLRALGGSEFSLFAHFPSAELCTRRRLPAPSPGGVFRCRCHAGRMLPGPPSRRQRLPEKPC